MNYEASCGAKYGTLSSGDRGGVGFEALIRSKGRRAAGSKKIGYVLYHISGPGGVQELIFGVLEPPK